MSAERPIEEIIGWRRCGRCGTWRRPDWDDDCGTPAATVDDLTWFAGTLGLRCVMASWHGVDGLHPEPCYASVGPPVEDGRPDFHGSGPTVLAALETAVRKAVGE